MLFLCCVSLCAGELSTLSQLSGMLSSFDQHLRLAASKGFLFDHFSMNDIVFQQTRAVQEDGDEEVAPTLKVSDVFL